jgi:predicted RNA-binding protein with RPS1 domain
VKFYQQRRLRIKGLSSDFSHWLCRKGPVILREASLQGFYHDQLTDERGSRDCADRPWSKNDMNPAEETPLHQDSPSPASVEEQALPAPEAAAPFAPEQSGEHSAPQGQQGSREARGERRGRGQSRGGGPRRDSQAQGTVENPEPPKPAAINASGRRLRRLIDEDLGDELEQAMSGMTLEGAASAFDSVPTTTPTPQPTTGRRDKVREEKKSYRVVDVRGGDIFVDLGGKSEGVISGLQFPEGFPKPGDFIDAIPERRQAADGVVRLRRPGEAESADWGSLTVGMIVDAQVKKVNKGGLEVTVNGIRAFMPAGQASADYMQDLGLLVGQTLRSEVTKVDVEGRDLVVSRKAVQMREREEKAQQTFATLQEGQVRDGVVKRLQDFGAFIDIGGVDGLLPISQMAWHRVKHPSDILQVGQGVKVQVATFDRETRRISLSLKQLLDSPWATASEKYKTGTVVSGVVTRVTDFGAFVELEPGIEGLVHISELSPNRVRRAADVAKPGEHVEVKVLNFDIDQKRIGLSIKQAIPAPEEEPAAEAAPTAAAEEPEAAAPSKPKKQQDLKGGLGGSGGPLFG